MLSPLPSRGPVGRLAVGGILGQEPAPSWPESRDELRLERECPSCHKGNLNVHSFCGWCGKPLSDPSVPVDSTSVTVIAAATCESGAITNVTSSTMSPQEVEVTLTVPISTGGGELVSGFEATVAKDLPQVDGLAIVLLGTPEEAAPPVTYRLDIGEPFDVAGPGIDSPATFTATMDGLRLDARGDVEDVYLRVRSRDRAIAYRKTKVERNLGTFQAVAPGETLPPGAMAIIGSALVRVDPITL